MLLILQEKKNNSTSMSWYIYIYSIVSTLSGIYYTTFLSGNELEAPLNSYLLCELPGYIMNNENDMITCSKNEIEKFSYTGLSISHAIFSYILMPLMLLLTIIEWKWFIQKMKVLLHMKNKELNASNLAQLNTSKLAILPVQINWKKMIFFVINFWRLRPT